jgi:xylan 1,4-beta-xylosidase
MQKKYEILKGTEIPFRNNVQFCVGTGRMGLALHKAYQEQLQFAQEYIGFKHIRGHGLFCEDMAIYHEYENEAGDIVTEYNFTYLDMVMDNYLSAGIRPFLELGFMPKQLASGQQTVFYWKGNVTPPKDYNKWVALVQATLRHLMERYGEEDVVRWPIEIWNEPNLKVFWQEADMQEYFRLYQTTVLAVKAVDLRFQVGGPAVCGVNDEIWVKSFLEFCRDHKVPVDFVTRHHYTIDKPEHIGHYGYAELREPEFGLKELQTTRDIVDSLVEFRNLDIHITEFSTAYIPNCPIHDTNLNAAYIAFLLSRLGDCNASYSYWTFGDIFEEQGVPFTPFHGGFGLVANGLIPKPTFWTFVFFKDLQGQCIHRASDSVIVRLPNGNYRGIAWNLNLKSESEPELGLEFLLPAFAGDEACMIQKTVDESCCNPLKIWHDIGEPSNPTKEQTALLRASAFPRITTNRIRKAGGGLNIQLTLLNNAVVYFEVFPVSQKSDRGYTYGR